MKVVKITNNDSSNDSSKEEVIIHRCPICGRAMNETYLSRDYCDECAEILKKDKGINLDL